MLEGSLLWLVPPLVALATSFLVVIAVRGWLLRLGLLDRPTSRSSHKIPMPRGGGVGILAGFLAGLGAAQALSIGASFARPSILEAPAVGGLLLGGGLIALVGLLDDVRSRTVKVRLAAQVLGAGLLVASVGSVDALRLPLVGEWRLGWLAAPLTMLWLVGVTNIYNFMDGIDGLAAGQAAIAGVCLALAGVQTGNSTVAVLSACLAAAALGFLAHNFPPARIFMGDVGSTFLGYTFAGLAVLGAQPGPARISIYISALMLAPFLFDATLTLLRRVWRGERWYEAHRSHLYQRLVQAGYSARRVSLLYYGLALVLGALGLAEVATGQGATETFFLIGLVPLALLALWVRRVEAG
ncbi:MAG: glycosyltransferase family 4 protein [Chloroflexi bacterium]|nr:glycosyltransferase family 4 protein [Chloroflexota bacterium]